MPKALITSKIVREAICPVGKTRLDYFDAKVPGFVLEVRATGGKTFYVRYRNRRGTQKQHKIGSAAIVSADDARRQAQKLLAQIALGEDPREERAALSQVPTLDHFIADRYMPYIKAYKRSWRADDSYLRNHILPRFGKSHLDQINKYEVIDWHHKNCASHLAVATTNRLMVLLRFIFNLAIKWDVPGVIKNPTAGVPLFEANNQRERYLSREETQRLYAAVLESPNAMLRYIVPTLILTGARKHEVLEARWDDLDLERRAWRIPTCKAGKARYVPLSEGAMRLLQTVPRFDGCPFVFPNPETLKPYSPMPGAWRTARKRAGLPEVRMHDLRHSFASFLVNSGRSLYEVQQILGHSSIRMTQRYAHLSQETLLIAANAAAEAAGIGLPPAERGAAPKLPLMAGDADSYSQSQMRRGTQ